MESKMALKKKKRSQNLLVVPKRLINLFKKITNSYTELTKTGNRGKEAVIECVCQINPRWDGTKWSQIMHGYQSDVRFLFVP